MINSIMVLIFQVEESLERDHDFRVATSRYQVYWKTLAFILLTFITMATAIGMYGIIFQ